MIERHPFEPFLPDGCRLLMLGSFPPGEKRWSMKFYYPNFTNDMWRIFGLCFYNDKMHFVDVEHKTFRLDLIIPFLREHGIGMYDTATAVIRLKNTASDKDLEVVEPTDLKAMAYSLPYRYSNYRTESHRCAVPMLQHWHATKGWRQCRVRL